MAPEVLRSANERGYDARKADVWSCGVVLYVMLVGYYPFSSSKPSDGTKRAKEATKFKILNLEYDLPSFLSPSVKSLLSNILNTVDKRYSMEEILQDPWFLTSFPDQAKTMNDEILRAEKKRRITKSSKEVQTVDEIAAIIKSAGSRHENENYCEYLISKQADIITDSQIDAAIDEVFVENSHS